MDSVAREIAYQDLDPEVEEEIRTREEKGSLLPNFTVGKLEREQQRSWDIFYKQSEDRFFKDRHWTLQEFDLPESVIATGGAGIFLVELGCGVGNAVWLRRRMNKI